MTTCFTPINGRRRIFWTTQPDACGTYQLCLSECGSSGLVSRIPAGQEGRTFDTNDYVRGLALNILGTDGRRPDTACGYRPGARGGHWADSFRDDNLTCGTTIRDIPAQKSVTDCLGLIRVYLLQAMQKLVSYGVAQTVSVDVSYAGSNNFNATINVNGNDGTSSRVGITGTRLENAWVWS